MKLDRADIKKFLKFIVTGVFVNVAALGLSYYLFKQPIAPEMTVTIVFIIAVAVSHAINYHWAFSSNKEDYYKSLVKFYLVNISAYFIQLLFMFIFYRKLGFSPFIIQCSAITVTTIFTFTLSNFFAFKRT